MRLFAAVWPDAATLEALARIPRPQFSDMRWTTPEQWHVTLHFFGEAGEPVELSAALAGVAGRFSPFSASVGPAVRPLGRSLLIVDVAGLDGLAAAVRAATSELAPAGAAEPGAGNTHRDRPFVGHLTLARGRGRADVRRRAGDPVSARWDVDEITLVASELRSSGAVYRYVGRYPLNG